MTPTPLTLLAGKPVRIVTIDGKEHRGELSEIHPDCIVLTVKSGFHQKEKLPVVVMQHAIATITEEIPEEPGVSFIEAAKLAEARRNKG